MVDWHDPDWPRPGEKAVIHYKVHTWQTLVAPGSNQAKTDSTVERLLMVGTDPFGPGGSLDGRIRRDERSKDSLGRIVARGKIENDSWFDAFAGEVFKRVVHQSNDDETRALAAEQALLIKSGETITPVCASCCRGRGSDHGIKFHRKTKFGWKIGSNPCTSTIMDGGPAIVSSTVCLVCLQSRYDEMVQMGVGPVDPVESLLSSPHWNVHDSKFIVNLCGHPGFKAGLDKLAKVVEEVRNS